MRGCLRPGAARLGHAPISITLGTYVQAVPAMQEEEEEALIAGLVFAGK